MIIYLGFRFNDLPCVLKLTIDGTSEKPEVVSEVLDAKPSLKVRNHSPDGFEWGYRGSGPSQLALALLLDGTECRSPLAVAHYQAFKEAYVSQWGPTWGVSQEQLVGWLERQTGIRA